MRLESDHHRNLQGNGNSYRGAGHLARLQYKLRESRQSQRFEPYPKPKEVSPQLKKLREAHGYDRDFLQRRADNSLSTAPSSETLKPEIAERQLYRSLIDNDTAQNDFIENHNQSNHPQESFIHDSTPHNLIQETFNVLNSLTYSELHLENFSANYSFHELDPIVELQPQPVTKQVDTKDYQLSSQELQIRKLYENFSLSQKELQNKHSAINQMLKDIEATISNLCYQPTQEIQQQLQQLKSTSKVLSNCAFEYKMHLSQNIYIGRSIDRQSGKSTDAQPRVDQQIREKLSGLQTAIKNFEECFNSKLTPQILRDRFQRLRKEWQEFTRKDTQTPSEIKYRL